MREQSSLEDRTRPRDYLSRSHRKPARLFYLFMRAGQTLLPRDHRRDETGPGEGKERKRERIRQGFMVFFSLSSSNPSLTLYPLQ